MSLIDNLNLVCSKKDYIMGDNKFLLELFSICDDPIEICKQLDHKTNKVLAKFYWEK